MYSTVYNFRMCRTCTVYRICSKLYSLQDVQNTVQFTGYTVNCTVYSICSTLYIFKIYSTLYRLWDIQCTLFCKYYIYSVLYSVNIIYTVHRIRYRAYNIISCTVQGLQYTQYSILDSLLSLRFPTFQEGQYFPAKKVQGRSLRENVPTFPMVARTKILHQSKPCFKMLKISLKNHVFIPYALCSNCASFYFELLKRKKNV